jgi:hypothetical protein
LSRVVTRASGGRWAALFLDCGKGDGMVAAPLKAPQIATFAKV